MGFASILTTITTYFNTLATTNSWQVVYDDDPTETPSSGLWMEFNIDFGESEQKELGINSYRNPGNVIVKIKNDAGRGLSGILAEVDTVAAAFRSLDVGNAVFRVPRIMKIGRIGELYQVNVICPFYLDN